MANAIIHAVHVILAGAWLGGVVFTTTVVSPALKEMGWSEPERVRVRSVIGGRYARVGTVNLVLLAVFAVLDGVTSRFGPLLYAEYALIVLLFVLVGLHGAYFGRRLAKLAEAERDSEDAKEARTLAARRHELQRISFRISMLNLLLSAAIAAVATAA